MEALQSSAWRTAQALWTLIEQQPQEVKDMLVMIIKSPTSITQEETSVRLKALNDLKGSLSDIPMGSFANDERAQYILGK